MTTPYGVPVDQQFEVEINTGLPSYNKGILTGGKKYIATRMAIPACNLPPPHSGGVYILNPDDRGGPCYADSGWFIEVVKQQTVNGPVYAYNEGVFVDKPKKMYVNHKGKSTDHKCNCALSVIMSTGCVCGGA